MVVTCAQCGLEFEAQRKTRRYCGQTCQKRAKAGKPPTTQAAGEQSGPEMDEETARLAAALEVAKASAGVVGATARELGAARKLDTVTGRQALAVAARIDLPGSSGSEVATLSRELSRLMFLAVGKGAQSEDPVDEVKAKRDAKFAKAREASR